MILYLIGGLLGGAGSSDVWCWVVYVVANLIVCDITLVHSRN